MVFGMNRKDRSGSDGKRYKIIRFQRGKDNYVVEEGLTLEEAQAHCKDPNTRGEGWFDGYTEE